MRKNWLLLSFLSICIFLPACSIYNSAGRKAFEKNAPTQANTNNVQVLSKQCWTQPANEPLWISQDNEPQHDQQYNVRTLSAEEIEVCLDETNHPWS